MNGERTWTKITRIVNIPLLKGRPIRFGNFEIAIFNLNGRFLTIENACPHKGGPLCDGIVTGTAVVCPLHGRHFDLETGMPLRSRALLSGRLPHASGRWHYSRRSYSRTSGGRGCSVAPRLRFAEKKKVRQYAANSLSV